MEEEKAIRSIDEAPQQAQGFQTVKTMKDRESERTSVATSHLSHLIYVCIYSVLILFVFSIINTLVNKTIK